MKQFVNFLSRHLSPPRFSDVNHEEKVTNKETQMEGIWQGYLHLTGKDIRPIWFLLKAAGIFEVFVSPFDKDRFRFNGNWEVDGNYFSAVFNGRIDTWVLDGVMNENADLIKGDIVIQGDLAEIIESESTDGVFILKK